MVQANFLFIQLNSIKFIALMEEIAIMKVDPAEGRRTFQSKILKVQ